MRFRATVRGSSSATRQRRAFFELLEIRTLLAGNLLTPAEVRSAHNLRTISIPSVETVYYDSFENGQLVGGRADLEPFVGPTAARVVAGPPSSVTTLINNGPTSNRVDVVLLGDGYTAAELGAYATHVEDMLDPFFAMQPLDEYKSFFNIHRVDVISNESGVDNDPTFGIFRDTALDAEYFANGVERLLGVDVFKAQTEAANAPDVDQILVLANSTKYGGAGYPTANLGTVAGNNPSSVEVAKHEFGHSFADLADEYDYADGSTYTGGEPFEVNASRLSAAEMEAAKAKWHRWLDEPNVDAFEGAIYKQFGAYRPTENSLMRNLGQPLEQVNVEQFVVSAYKTVKPIDAATPAGTYEGDATLFVTPVVPLTHSLDVQWFLDGAPIAGATDSTIDLGSLGLGSGTFNLEVVVVDNTSLVRDPELRSQWMSETRSWTIENTSSNVPPAIGNFGAILAFVENQSARTLGSVATLTDPDSADFAGGVLTVSISANASADDFIEIRNRSTIADRIGTNGTSVTFNGVTVGSFSGGTNNTPLTVDLLDTATLPIVRSLIRSITFRTQGDKPSTATRTVSFELSDGDGGTSNVGTKLVSVAAVNDRPVLAMGGTTGYKEGAAPSVLTTTGTVSDPDSPNFGSGNLTARVTTNASTSDRLEIQNQGTTPGKIGATAGGVTFSGVSIGTYTGGNGNNALKISLNNSATIAAVQALVRAITFRSLGTTPSTLQRTISLIVNDGDGAVSRTATKLVSVVAVPPPPSLPSTTRDDSSAQVVTNGSSDSGSAVASLAVSSISPTVTQSKSTAKPKRTNSVPGQLSEDQLTKIGD